MVCRRSPARGFPANGPFVAERGAVVGRLPDAAHEADGGLRIVGGDVAVDVAHVVDRVLQPADVHGQRGQRVPKVGGGAGSSPRDKASR